MFGNWSKSKTVRFLKAIQKDNMIRYENETVTVRITVINYDSYQGLRNESDSKVIRERFADDSQTERNRSTNNNANNVNKGNKDNTPLNPPKGKPNKDKPKKFAFGEFENVMVTEDELNKLGEKLGGAVQRDNMIERLSGYLASTGKKYKSHYATMLNWARKDQSGNNGGTKPQQSTGDPIEDAIRAGHISRRSETAARMYQEACEKEEREKCQQKNSLSIN
jgi:hypothetical protein